MWKTLIFTSAGVGPLLWSGDFWRTEQVLEMQCAGWKKSQQWTVEGSWECQWSLPLHSVRSLVKPLLKQTTGCAAVEVFTPISPTPWTLACSLPPSTSGWPLGSVTLAPIFHHAAYLVHFITQTLPRWCVGVRVRVSCILIVSFVCTRVQGRNSVLFFVHYCSFLLLMTISKLRLDLVSGTIFMGHGGSIPDCAAFRLWSGPPSLSQSALIDNDRKIICSIVFLCGAPPSLLFFWRGYL